MLFSQFLGRQEIISEELQLLNEIVSLSTQGFDWTKSNFLYCHILHTCAPEEGRHGIFRIHFPVSTCRASVPRPDLTFVVMDDTLSNTLCAKLDWSRPVSCHKLTTLKYLSIPVAGDLLRGSETDFGQYTELISYQLGIQRLTMASRSLYETCTGITDMFLGNISVTKTLDMCLGKF